MSPSEVDGRIQIISDFAVCHDDARRFLLADSPGFLSRIGGSDTDIITSYHKNLIDLGPAEALSRAQAKFHMARIFNGYYDKAEKQENIVRFCELLLEGYRQCGQLLLCGPLWLSEFMPETNNPVFHIDTSLERDALHRLANSIGELQRPVRFYPYPYVERILHGQYTLFRAFADCLPGKKVLVVSPFEESIRANFSRRHDFFPNYAYPEFDLLTYNTPITYAGLPDEFYPDQDWFSTLERMKREIAALDFDVALLSCGSYAVPLGLHVRDALGRKAIYCGGCLQLFFGITGRRYDNPFFIDQINPSAFIYPLERERFLPHTRITSESPRDAFGAYF